MAETRATLDVDQSDILRRYNDASKELQDFLKQNKDMLIESGLDIAGIFDPTPASDVASAGMAAARGDYLGAGLSLFSAFVPYFGDALGKPLKALRSHKKMSALLEACEAATAKATRLREEIIDAQQMVAARVRELRRKNPPKGTCKQWGTRLPAEGRGTWANPDKAGDCKWTSKDGSYSIEYKEGYPDFQTARVDGEKVTWNPAGEKDFDGKVTILDMKGSKTDFESADKAMGARLNDPAWRRPKGYTWHHGEDGVSMTLVRSDAHHAIKDGKYAPVHTGGDSLSGDF